MTSEEGEQKPKKKRIKSIVNFSALGMQIVAIIWGGSYLGSWIDNKYEIKGNWFTLALVLISVTVSIYYTIKRLNQLNK